MAAAHYHLKKPVALAVTLGDQLVHLKMANYAKTCSYVYNKKEEKKKKKSEYQLKLHVNGKSDTKSQIYITQQDAAIYCSTIHYGYLR
jgi:hypothetical protein